MIFKDRTGGAAAAFFAAVFFAACQQAGVRPAADKGRVWEPPYKGPAAALVTIHEFSDFECPFCSKVGPILDQLMKNHANDVKLVFRQFPLQFHKYSFLAAEAMLAAHDQGRGWEMLDSMFRHQDMISFEGGEALSKMARDEVQIQDPGRFNKALAEGTFRKKVREDADLGKLCGVYATPSLLVNGVLITGAPDLDTLERAFADAESRARELLAKGVPLEGLDAAFLEQAKRTGGVKQESAAPGKKEERKDGLVNPPAPQGDDDDGEAD
jgi:protein-disulfide isomerase